MPANKDLKRLVRGRMQKTGEAYTTARAQLLEQKPAAAAPPESAPSAAPDYAKLAGRSDTVLKEKTGCTWEDVPCVSGSPATCWRRFRCWAAEGT